MATSRYDADTSSIGRVSARSDRFSAASPTSVRLPSMGAGASAAPVPRFVFAAPADSWANPEPEAPEARARAKAQPSRVAAIADRLQERIAGTNRKLLVFGLVATALVVCVCALYGPLRDYYVARRNNEYLTVQLEAIESSNADVEADLRALQTREGIEDEARRRGYIEQGSNAVNVLGLPEGTDARATGGEAAFTEVQKVDTHWYTNLLDTIFQYTPPEV